MSFRRRFQRRNNGKTHRTKGRGGRHGATNSGAAYMRRVESVWLERAFPKLAGWLLNFVSRRRAA